MAARLACLVGRRACSSSWSPSIVAQGGNAPWRGLCAAGAEAEAAAAPPPPPTPTAAAADAAWEVDPAGALRAGAAGEFAEWFRRSNTSFPELQGKVVVGRVRAVNARSGFAEVSTGLKGSITFPLAELAAGGPPPEVGDELELLVQHVETPFGEAELLPHKVGEEARLVHVWRELERIKERNGTVSGRVLNPVNGGFAVGVAGYVAFLPHTRVPRNGCQVGRLVPFRIVGMNEENKNIVVSAAATPDGPRRVDGPFHRRGEGSKRRFGYGPQ